MWPVNLLFFLVPGTVIILVFFLLPYINSRNEPFGYKLAEPIPREKFTTIRNVYLRKLFLFSVPFTLMLTISNMYILSAFTGSLFLGILILGLAGINFFFYFQAYKAIESENSKLLAEPTLELMEKKTENDLPKW